MDKKFEPFIKAIMQPALEEISGLDELTTQELVNVIKNFSDEDVLGLAMPRPGHEGVYGFMLNPRVFGIMKSKERLVEITTALMNRFSEAQKNKSDWGKYVCQLRKNSE